MSWQLPNCFGPSMSDQAMMEEVLELLAEDSSTGDDRTASTTASSRSASNNSDNQSSLSGFNRSSVTSRDDSVGQGGIENLEVIRVVGPRNEDPNNDCEGEETHPVGTTVPAPHPFGSHSTPCPLVCRVCRQHDLRFLAGSPGMIAAAAAIPGSSCTPVTARLPSTMGQVADLASTPLAPTTRPTPQPPRESAATRKKMRAATGTSTTHVPSTGQRVHVMNGAEFDELRRKLRMQTASRRYRKRKKDEARQQKMKIQELQSELFRLQELEAQSKKYQERSQESLESELKIHEDEIGNLWGKMQEAAKEELDWVSMMSSHLSD